MPVITPFFYVVDYPSPVVVCIWMYTMYRTAIEEELEVLYEAYYEDLEQYANLQQQYASSGGPPPPGPGPFPGSVALDSNGAVIGAGTNTHPTTKHPPNHRKQGAPPATNGNVRKPRAPAVQDEEEFDEGEDDYDDDDEEYDEEDEEEEGDDEEEVDDEEDDGKYTSRGFYLPS